MFLPLHSGGTRGTLDELGTSRKNPNNGLSPTGPFWSATAVSCRLFPRTPSTIKRSQKKDTATRPISSTYVIYIPKQKHKKSYSLQKKGTAIRPSKFNTCNLHTKTNAKKNHTHCKRRARPSVPTSSTHATYIPKHVQKKTHVYVSLNR